jgi:hypothetical protein
VHRQHQHSSALAYLLQQASSRETDTITPVVFANIGFARAGSGETDTYLQATPGNGHAGGDGGRLARTAARRDAARGRQGGQGGQSARSPTEEGRQDSGEGALLVDFCGSTCKKLFGSCIDDPFAQALGALLRTEAPALARVTALNFSSNDIGDLGAASLGLALATSRSVSSVDLSRCRIGDLGARGLGCALRTNKVLTALDVSHNLLSDAGIMTLVQAAQANSSRALEQLKTGSGGGGGRPHNSINPVDAARRATALRESIIGSVRLQAGVWTMDLTGRGLNTLGAAVVGACLRDVESARCTRALLLGNNHLGDDGAVLLASVLADCAAALAAQGQPAWRSPEHDEDGHGHLYSSDDDSDDQGDGNNAAADASLALGAVSGAGASELPSAGAAPPPLMVQITKLDLSCNGVTDRGAKALAAVLSTPEGQTVMHLNLRAGPGVSNVIGDEGVVAIGDMLHVNHCLVSLNLAENNLRPMGVRALVRAFAINKTLLRFNNVAVSLFVSKTRNNPRLMGQDSTDGHF